MDVSEEVRGEYHKNPKTSTNGLYLLQTFCQAVYQGWPMHLREQSVMDILRLEVALLRFKADKHTFPTTLAELSPKYLKTMPVDPLDSNKPYKYQLKPDGAYLLYGLGQDMVDHRGSPGSYAGDKGFDMVAGHLARKVKLPVK